jgi:hypothetical protein
MERSEVSKILRRGVVTAATVALGVAYFRSDFQDNSNIQYALDCARSHPVNGLVIPPHADVTINIKEQVGQPYDVWVINNAEGFGILASSVDAPAGVGINSEIKIHGLVYRPNARSMWLKNGDYTILARAQERNALPNSPDYLNPIPPESLTSRLKVNCPSIPDVAGIIIPDQNVNSMEPL